MAQLAITFGLLLGILGTGFFYWTGMVWEHITALIPAFFGLVLVVLGLLALGPKIRMHAMHGAAVLGLAGLAIPTYRVVRGFADGKEMKPAILTEHILMAVLCGVFLILCIKSFIDARRRRRQGIS